LKKAEFKGIFASGQMPAGAEYKAALGDILQTFPYFQLAQVLLAKQMYDTHEPEAPGRIKLASVYAPDRKAMYLLFKANSPVQTSTGGHQLKADRIKPQEKEEVKYNFVYRSTTTEKIEVTSTPKEESTQTETFIRKELEAKLPVKPAIEKPIQPAAVEKPEVKKVEVQKPYLPPVIEKKVEEKKPEPKKVEAIAPIKVEPPPIEKKAEPETIAPVVTNEPITDNNLKYSFSSWLKVIPEISIEKKQEIKQISPKETSNIIDSFLKKAPTISRPKAEFFSPVKAAKLSITEDDGIVSETLAKIYVTQGNLPRALKAYQTLLLQFPEKKNIFAPRIEEIKALIRQNTKPGTK
jgi:hypothetical protein